MDYEGQRAKIINIDRYKEEGCYLNLDEYIGQSGEIVQDYGDEFRFVIEFDNEHLRQLNSENGYICFRFEDIEFLPCELDKEDTYIHVKQPKPPLGVMPKKIFETQRICELTRALYEYAYFQPEDIKYDSMLNWAEELVERLRTQSK